MSTDKPSQTDIRQARKAAKKRQQAERDKYAQLRDCMDVAAEKDVQDWEEATLALSMFGARTDGLLPRPTSKGHTSKCRECNRIPEHRDGFGSWEVPDGSYCPPCALRRLLDILG